MQFAVSFHGAMYSDGWCCYLHTGISLTFPWLSGTKLALPSFVPLLQEENTRSVGHLSEAEGIPRNDILGSHAGFSQQKGGREEWVFACNPSGSNLVFCFVFNVSFYKQSIGFFLSIAAYSAYFIYI